MTNIIQVKYINENTGELSPRNYSYYAEDELRVGDFVMVPVRDTTVKAMVTSVDLPEETVAAFKDKVKTIPAGSMLPKPEPVMALISLLNDAAEIAAEEGYKEAPYILDPNMSLESQLSGEFGPPSPHLSQPDTDIQPSPGTDLEVIEWHWQGVSLQEYAEARVIRGLDDLKLATKDLSVISHLKKVMEEKRKYVVQPLNDQVKAINENYKKLMQPVLDAERITKQKMLDFNAEQEHLRKQQEEINRLRMEAAQKEAAINEGEITEPVKLVEVVPEAPKHISTDLGSSGMRDNWKARVIDFDILPNEYKLPNEAMLNAYARTHKGEGKVPGVEFYNQPIIATRTK